MDPRNLNPPPPYSPLSDPLHAEYPVVLKRDVVPCPTVLTVRLKRKRVKDIVEKVRRWSSAVCCEVKFASA